MMFMMTMPPTTSERLTTPISIGEDAGRRLVVEFEERVRREDAEVVRLASAAAAAAIAQRHASSSSIAVCTSDGSRRPHGELQRLARAEDPLERAERNHRELVLRLAEDRSLLRRDADDPEVDAADA